MSDPVDIGPFTPDKGDPEKFNQWGTKTLDGFTPTTRYQLAEVRRFAVKQCADIGAEAVRFTINWVHLFPSVLTIDCDGFIVENVDNDLSFTQTQNELIEILG